MEVTDCVVSAKYRVRYVREGARVEREMVAVYLGVNTQGGTDWSGRPVFGTTTLPDSWFRDAEMVPGNTKCYTNRRAREVVTEEVDDGEATA